MHKRIALIVGLAIVCVGLASAQSPQTAAGDMAVTLSLQGLGTFGIDQLSPVEFVWDNTPAAGGGFAGAAIPAVWFGFRYFIFADIEARLLLGFGFEYPDPDTAQGVLGFDFSGLWHVIKAGQVSFYAGAALRFGFSSNSIVAGANTEPDVFHGTVMEIGVLGGAELFVLDSLSISAECGIDFKSESGSWTYFDGTGETLDGGWWLGTAVFGVLLNVHF
jgi:hypothetical protein